MPRMKSGKSPKGPVCLTPEQAALKDRLRVALDEIIGKIHSNARLSPGEIDRLGETAAELHQSLEASGVSVRHHKYMVENRRLKPDDPEFYKHVHPVEDLLKFIAEQSANDDPEDQTLNIKFNFEVFGRRWGHTDTYKLTRTKSGWIVAHMQEVTAGRDGRVGGKPGTGLFNLLDHDSINYPEELPGYLEWLWERAAEDGLSREQVQEALTMLANWVSLVEKNSPTGVFQGYK
jgi:integron cassette protein